MKKELRSSITSITLTIRTCGATNDASTYTRSAIARQAIRERKKEHREPNGTRHSPGGLNEAQ